MSKSSLPPVHPTAHPVDSSVGILRRSKPSCYVETLKPSRFDLMTRLPSSHPKKLLSIYKGALKVVEEALDVAEVEWSALPMPQRVRSRPEKEAEALVAKVSFDPLLLAPPESLWSPGGKDFTSS
ncbi:hypothetical protein AMTRI_Chr07g25430 [Amborella trichopoda]